MHYRKKQKSILKSLNSSKTFIYWIYNITKIDDDDIMHWWGKTGLLPPGVEDKRIITSHSTGPFYIDKGVGNHMANRYYDYSTWLDIYKVNLG